MDTKTSFKDLFSFPGFRASARLKAHPEHPGARITTLRRRQKKRFARAGKFIAVGMTAALRQFAILIPAAFRFIWNSKSVGSNVAGAKP